MPTGKIGKERTKATRYRTEDDPDDGSMALLAASTGPPAMCAVFVIPDEDEAQPEYIQDAENELRRVIGKLRALNLNVDEFRNKSNTHIYVKISAPDTLLRYEAEAGCYKVKMMPDYGGAMCSYSVELEEKGAFDKPMDNAHPLFSSATQLRIIRSVVYSEAYQPEPGEEDDMVNFDLLISRPPPNEDEPIVLAYFGLHHERIRLKLLHEWALVFSKPQPLELVREYFGEKYGLFYTWFGFYCTMLWIPSIFSVFVSMTQILSFVETGTLENPYMLVWATTISLWATCFCALWKQLENTRKYQWGMLKFDRFQELREDFKENPKTIKKVGNSDECDPHINEVTEDEEDYWYDEGQYLPFPTGRARDQLVTLTVVGIIIAIVVVAFVFVWVNVMGPMMKPGDVLVGAIVGGVANSVITIAIDIIMDGIGEIDHQGLTSRLVLEENWDTDTKYEDALILKTCYFKMFSKYFALGMVCFFVNYVELLGAVHKCPEFQCLPIAQFMFVTMSIIDIIYQVVEQQVLPRVVKMIDNMNASAALREMMGEHRTPQEEQFDWTDPTPIVDLYKDKVFQFGYIVMFSVLCPFVVPVFLAINLVELRSRPAVLLTRNRRPDYLMAASIGQYQPILEVRHSFHVSYATL
jgi:hypothetical protein